MKNHLWSLVVGRYPQARLVEATKKTILFTNEGSRTPATSMPRERLIFLSGAPTTPVVHGAR